MKQTRLLYGFVLASLKPSPTLGGLIFFKLIPDIFRRENFVKIYRESVVTFVVANSNGFEKPLSLSPVVTRKKSAILQSFKHIRKL